MVGMSNYITKDEIVKVKGSKLHVGCEGAIIKGRCLRCGRRTKPLHEKVLGSGPLVTETHPETSSEYKKRLRRQLGW